MENRQKLAALFLFFFSGFSALIYEIIWARMLTFVFGTSIEAISAVITAFMFGLALGSYFAGRHADFIRRHLTAYAITEFFIGLSGLALYFLITNIPVFIKFFHPHEAGSEGLLFTLTIYLLNFIIIAIPTTLMGATLPLICKHYIRSNKSIGLGIGMLYGINTFGAVMGTLFCGFILIPYLGIWKTNLFAVLINFLLGISAYSLARLDRRRKVISIKEVTQKTMRHITPALSADRALVLAAFLLSGFAAMAYEVTWTKLLIMIIGNSVYAFSSILVVFLLGLALGSLLIARYVDRIKDLFLCFALLEIFISLYIAVSLPFADRLPLLFQYLYNRWFTDFFSIELITFFIVAVMIFVPTLLMGAIFPVVNRIISSRFLSLGSDIGTSYSVNTIGGIFGAILAGFYFIPALGVEKTMIMIISFNLFAGAALFIKAESLQPAYKMGSILAMGVLFTLYTNLLPEWNKNFLNSGVYVYASLYKQNIKESELENVLDGAFKLVYYKEGKFGTVAVRDGKYRALQVNGKTEGGTGPADMRTQIMVAALPLMHGNHAKNVAMIGLGTGVSLGVAERFPIKKIDCIEISPDVIEASHFFDKVNHRALNSPKLNMILADGRNFFTYTEKKYDVIISEPSNPWITGVSNLFTLDFFKIARERLNKNGIMAQWVQLYSLDTRELKVLMHTFQKAFPHVSVWMFSPSDMIMLGSVDNNLSDFSGMEQAFAIPDIYRDFWSIGIREPRDILKGYLFGTQKTHMFSDGAALNTDDLPLIEFQAPKSLYNPSPEKNVSALKRCC